MHLRRLFRDPDIIDSPSVPEQVHDPLVYMLRITVEWYSERHRTSGYEDLPVGLSTDEIDDFVMVHGVPLLKGVGEKGANL